MNAEPKISRRPRCGEWLFSPHLATVTASSVSGNVFIPQTPEAFVYDDDLTGDGRWTYTWDAENRLVQMTAHTTIPTDARKRMVFEYDGQGRRIHKQVYEWDSTDYSTTASLDQRFVYDGWNLLAIFDSPSSILQSFTWGLDLSGSLQGAGGVGGLLLVTDHTSPVTSHFAAYDGNGNVAALVKTSDGTTTANYEYGPFGELIRATGPMAKANPFRFSTKYQDEESDLLYYGLRYYGASTGRWPNRDPLGETGFYYVANLGAEVMSRLPFSADSPYSFLRNSPISNFDFLGLCDPDAKEQLTIRMTSVDKDLVKLFKDLPHAKDYKDMISKLKCKSDSCVKSFVLVAHGDQSTIQFNRKDRDLNMNWADAEKMWGDVKANACFCRKCFVYLLSCYTGDQNGPTTYAQKVANATGCTVVAPKGYCWPNPDNPFSSKVDNDDDGKTPFTKKDEKWIIATPIGGTQ